MRLYYREVDPLPKAAAPDPSDEKTADKADTDLASSESRSCNGESRQQEAETVHSTEDSLANDQEAEEEGEETEKSRDLQEEYLGQTNETGNDEMEGDRTDDTPST